MSGAYYNEFDSYAAAWLRNLIAEGLIAPGDVDERSITEVQADDLRGYTQCHFFAGVGGWSRALRLAGWDDARPVWTGSCPCQPFSAAGKRKGAADERHLWPEFHRLIAERAPATVFGEQVASKDGRGWLAGVRLDLEGLGYAVGAADLCAASAGAPHIRQRLFWLADAASARRIGALSDSEGEARDKARLFLSGAGGAVSPGRLALSDRGQRDGLADGEGRFADGATAGRIESDRLAKRGGATGGLGDADAARLPTCECPAVEREGWRQEGRAALQSSGASGGRSVAERCGESRLGNAEGCDRRLSARPLRQENSQPAGASEAGFWSDCDWLPCTDGKARRVEPGTFPLAHGVSGRVAVARPGLQGETALQETDIRWISRTGSLRGFGNAIVPQVAAEFIRCADEAMRPA